MDEIAKQNEINEDVLGELKKLNDAIEDYLDNIAMDSEDEDVEEVEEDCEPEEVEDEEEV